MHLDAGDAEDDLDVVGHGELDVLEPVRGLTLVDERRAGHQREEGIVDRGDEVRRIDRRVVGRGPEPSASRLPEVALLLAGPEGVLGIRLRLPATGPHRGAVGQVGALSQRERVVALGPGPTGT